MKLRKYFLPNNVADWSSFIFISLIVPFFYWFVLFVVLPDLYGFSSVWYWIHCIFGSFLMTNIVSNLLAVMFVDTSIFSVTIPREKSADWIFCNTCELPVPPRCWHCDTCNKCILKRDHHCTFSGCCIGHFNHRFFMMFLSYFFIACCYALYFNLFFILARVTLDFNIIFQIFCPLMLILLGIDKAFNHMLMILLVLNIVGVIVTGLLLRFHLRLVFTGSVSYEVNRSITKYNFGFKHNIINIFGERWYVAWMSPFLHSSLIFDGVDWDLENNAQKTKFV